MKSIYKCIFDGYDRNPLRPRDAVCRPNTVRIFAKSAIDVDKVVRKLYVVKCMRLIEKVR